VLGVGICIKLLGHFGVKNTWGGRVFLGAENGRGDGGLGAAVPVGLNPDSFGLARWWYAQRVVGPVQKLGNRAGSYNGLKIRYSIWVYR
jgi:hypothetical protein